MILGHKTVPNEQLPRLITIRCLPEGWKDQRTYEELVGSSVQQTAKGIPNKTVHISVKCI
jgi:hypothetical protein